MNANRQAHHAAVSRHFDALAATWENHYVDRGSMDSRRQRFAACLQAVLAPPADLLDFGCGSGDLSIHFRRLGYRVLAADQSAAMIARAKERFTGSGVNFQLLPQTDTLTLPFASQQFDAVVLSSVIEYLAPVEGPLKELRRVLRIGGWMLFSAPNLRHPVRAIESAEIWSLERVPALRVLWPARRADYLSTSVTRLSIGRWRLLLKSTGWSLINVSGSLTPLSLMLCRAL